MPKDRRSVTLTTHFDTREAESGDKHIEGYFVVFNSNYELWPGASESVDPHAFDNESFEDIRALINHDPTLVIGRTKAGTLTLSVDERGLKGDILINTKDQDAVNCWERVQRGDVDQCSFGFDILDEDYEEKDGQYHWTIKSVKLYEVSVCTFPAYTETSVSARKDDLKNIKQRSVEATKNKLLKILGGN